MRSLRSVRTAATGAIGAGVLATTLLFGGPLFGGTAVAQAAPPGPAVVAPALSGPHGAADLPERPGHGWGARAGPRRHA
ncbi:hypothetical protein, partial [Mycobacterium kiyosense]|uniref:hypothetical protein n=1 Tax=Mycobacterium kiyosense TaxID=2871094 RepID=UPI00222EF8E3